VETSGDTENGGQFRLTLLAPTQGDAVRKGKCWGRGAGPLVSHYDVHRSDYGPSFPQTRGTPYSR